MKKLLLLFLLTLSFVTLAADVNYRQVGTQLRGDDGSTCRQVGNQWRCKNVKGNSDDDWGWGSNRIKYFVDDGPYDYDKAAQGLMFWLDLFESSNAPTINNSLRNTPYYDFGKTYTRKGDMIYGSDGLKCSVVTYSFNFNNGVKYENCGNYGFCGSDGTSYFSTWRNSGDDNYYCVNSSFGSKCCGTRNRKTCR